MVVAVGTACGCPPVSADQTGKTTKLLGTGCATVGARVGSAMDNAVLVCATTGACPVWTSMVSCVDQQLTGGTDPATGMPACVCKAPAKAGQYYVDPDPAMSTFMNGAPTGAQFPAACRFRTLTTAFAQTTPAATEVVSQHESSSNVHFLTKTGLPAVTDCTLQPNTCEVFPLNIPAGVHLYTADVGSFNPNHYVIDIDTTGNSAYGVQVGTGATVEGYTFDASGTTPANQGCQGAKNSLNSCPTTPITAVIQSALNNTPAALSPFTATLNQVQVLTRTTGAAAAFAGQTGVLLQGQAAWTAHYLTVVGGSADGTVNRGVWLGTPQGLAGAALSLAADHLNIILTGGPSQIGVDVGLSTQAPVTTAVANTVTITNDAVDATNNRGIRVGAGGTGIRVYNGTVTTTGLTVTSSATPVNALTGYQILNTNSPAAMGVNINSGLIVGGNFGGTGVSATGGFTTINSTHITGGTGFTGVVSQSTTAAMAANVTVTGTAAAKTVIDAIAGSNSTAITGIVVGSGTEYTTAADTLPSTLAYLTITDHTFVKGYTDGLVINNGHVISTGTDVAFTANGRDGIQILSDLNIAGTNPMDPLSRVSITGASITGNGRGGVLVRDVAPVLLDGLKITMNGTALTGGIGPFATTGNVAFGGIDVQRSQVLSQTAFLFTLQNSTVSQNAGCGITLSGGGDDLVNRASTAVRICGFGGTGTAPVGATPGSDVTITAPAYVAGSTAAAAIGTTFGGPTNKGGKVSATLLNNTVQNNTGVGIYITEARDLDPALAGADDVTEATVQGNKVTGNLSQVSATGTEPTAGGIYVAASDDNGPGTLNADRIACTAGAGGACTRVRMQGFLGNVIECNGRAQLSFAIPQRASTSAMGSAWAIDSDTGVVGVTLAGACMASVKPNTLAGYTPPQSSGLAIPGSATTATGQSLIHVTAYGVFWNTTTLAPGNDYSASLAGTPVGNDDASTWGVCPGAAAVTCPVALAQ
jgi:hypothetical protein